MSVQFAYGSYTSQVAEVEVAADGSVKVKRIVCALDCGMYVNPDTIEAQVQGGTLFGLTAALHGSITFKDGRVEQSNFDNYLPMRIDEVPVVETHLIKNAEAPGGVGEAPTAIVSAAVTNAIFAATGKRVRSLPIDTNGRGRRVQPIGEGLNRPERAARILFLFQASSDWSRYSDILWAAMMTSTLFLACIFCISSVM
ncbi:MULTISPECIES: molybdopterin cofactor-binding domain-containing protein [Bradyrhizobium]|uniref:molybdopterin cofactor-binding domain-containing protein n=1 Tax=Bradyrhizobium TaxID=374 RepID=UPI00216811BC|nr:MULTISPECIES: molybdopterin cofactor-binding domain-containing protein [Bradyrhizobium]